MTADLLTYINSMPTHNKLEYLYASQALQNEQQQTDAIANMFKTLANNVKSYNEKENLRSIKNQLKSKSYSDFLKGEKQGTDLLSQLGSQYTFFDRNSDEAEALYNSAMNEAKQRIFSDNLATLQGISTKDYGSLLGSDKPIKGLDKSEFKNNLLRLAQYNGLSGQDLNMLLNEGNNYLANLQNNSDMELLKKNITNAIEAKKQQINASQPLRVANRNNEYDVALTNFFDSLAQGTNPDLTVTKGKFDDYLNATLNDVNMDKVINSLSNTDRSVRDILSMLPSHKQKIDFARALVGSMLYDNADRAKMINADGTVNTDYLERLRDDIDLRVLLNNRNSDTIRKLANNYNNYQATSRVMNDLNKQSENVNALDRAIFLNY